MGGVVIQDRNKQRLGVRVPNSYMKKDRTLLVLRGLLAEVTYFDPNILLKSVTIQWGFSGLHDSSLVSSLCWMSHAGTA